MTEKEFESQQALDRYVQETEARARKGMRIVSLVAENIKRLTCVEITPEGNLVQITGRNGQGKTSVLDSIWWALTGATHIQAAPIRKGANEARIRLNLGELIITRTFRRKGEGEGFTTSIAVEKADGARFPSPQTMIDALLGELSFDPLSFARMKPKDQFEQLRRFVPDVDFAAIDNANRGDFDRRTEISRFARQERAAAQTIITPVGTPDELVDVKELTAQLEAAGRSNTELEQRRSNRARMANNARVIRDGIAKDVATIADMEAEIVQMRASIERRSKEAGELEERLLAAPALPAPIDTTPIRKSIDQAEAININVRRLSDRLKHVERAQQLEQEADALTAQIKKRDEDKRAAIAAAKLPIDGLGFGDGVVLLNGVPFEQASDAEQLQASVAIAAALNPKLRVIRIRDGSLLDDLAMARLAKFAQDLDMQIWIERVDSSGKVGFVLEDGHLKQVEHAEGAAA